VDEILVSDDDRNAVVRQLQKHTADGRLTIDEFSDRVEEAYRARTASDLRTVLRNLPALVPPTPSIAPRPERHRRPWFALPLAILFVLLGIWAITGSFLFPVPLIFICFFWTGRRRRHAYYH